MARFLSNISNWLTPSFLEDATSSGNDEPEIVPERRHEYSPANESQPSGNALGCESSQINGSEECDSTHPHRGRLDSIKPKQQEGMQTVKRKERQPQTYDGKTCEFQDFINHFEQVSKWNGWDDREKTMQLTMSLRGQAMRAVSDLNEATDDYDYEELKAALRQRFCPAERGAAWRCEFRGRTKSKDEKVSDFGYSLKRLAALAYPEIASEAREVLIIDQFIAGLNDQALRRHVQFNRPVTVDSAISFALEFEAFEGTWCSRKAKPVDSTEGSTGARVMAVSQNSELSEIKQTLENLQRQLRSRPSLSDRVCYNCGKKGHLYRDCRAPKSHEGGNRQSQPQQQQQQHLN